MYYYGFSDEDDEDHDDDEDRQPKFEFFGKERNRSRQPWDNRLNWHKSADDQETNHVNTSWSIIEPRK